MNTQREEIAKVIKIGQHKGVFHLQTMGNRSASFLAHLVGPKCRVGVGELPQPGVV